MFMDKHLEVVRVFNGMFMKNIFRHFILYLIVSLHTKLAMVFLGYSFITRSIY